MSASLLPSPDIFSFLASGAASASTISVLWWLSESDSFEQQLGCFSLNFHGRSEHSGRWRNFGRFGKILNFYSSGIIGRYVRLRTLLRWVLRPGR
jgi:hypothetical protein